MQITRLISIFLILLSVLFSTSPAYCEPVSYEAIHYALEKLPIAYEDRNDSYKPEQLRIVARAIESATQMVRWPENDRVSLAAYLVSIGYHESRYTIRIHAGVPKAHSYGNWQVEPLPHRVRRVDLIGLTFKETESSALIAAGVLAKSWQCGGRPQDIFSAYGGRACKTDWKTLKSRVSTFWWVRSMIVTQMKDYWNHNGKD